MKFYMITIVLLSLFNTVKAQDSIAVPEFINSVYLINGSGITALEKQQVSAETKASASTYIVGIGKAKGRNVVKSANSPVRVRPGAPVRFIVQLENNKVEPTTIINVFRLESDKRKNRRTLEVGRAGTFSGSSDMNIAFIPFEHKTYKDNCLIFQVNALEPGEYAITLEGSRLLFQMFGIDNK